MLDEAAAALDRAGQLLSVASRRAQTASALSDGARKLAPRGSCGLRNHPDPAMTAHRTASQAGAMEAIAPAIPARRLPGQVNLNAVLALVAVAQFMVILDGTVVNVALPTIQGHLGFSQAEPLLDPERLHVDVRRLSAARRAPRRPARAPPPVRRRHRAVLRRVAGLRTSRSPRACCWSHAACRASAGRWSRRRRSRSSSRPSREGPERNRALGGLGRDRRRGRSRRPAPRRRDRGGPELALGVLHQRPDRGRGLALAPRIVPESRSESGARGGYDVGRRR